MKPTRSAARPHVIAAAACALVAVSAAAATAAQEPAPQAAPAHPAYSANYRLHYLGGHAAEVLAWEQCPTKDCRVAVEGTVLQVVGTAEVQEKVSRALARADSEPRTQVFQLTLLIADSGSPGTAGPDLSAGAQKALKDIQGFLPFKGYHVLDRALLRSTRTVAGRLVGEHGEIYDVKLGFQSSNLPDGIALQVDDFLFETHDHSSLIHTSFGMRAGETVVVGTSRMRQPDQALVLLLTAVP